MSDTQPATLWTYYGREKIGTCTVPAGDGPDVVELPDGRVFDNHGSGFNVGINYFQRVPTTTPYLVTDFVPVYGGDDA